MNKDLMEYLDIKKQPYGVRPCLLVMANSREHEVAIEFVGEKFVVGYIAHYLRVCLFEANSRSPKLSLMIAKGADVQRECYSSGKQVFLDQECFIQTPHRFLANIDEISAADLINCPYFPVDPRRGDAFDSDILLSAIPALKDYFVEGQGFVSNPSAQAGSEVIKFDKIIPGVQRSK